jgi:hypothetical protein
MLSHASRSLRGWIVLPFDHNSNKLAVACPILLRHRFSTLFPIRCSFPSWPFLSVSAASNYRRHRQSFSETCCSFKSFLRTLPPHVRSLCKQPTRASFLTYAYGLPKFKDWTRFRPLISYARHPFKRLLNFCSRALLFILSHADVRSWTLPTEHCLPVDLPTSFEQVRSRFGIHTSFLFLSADVKNMYTSLPHSAILAAVSWLLSRFQRITGKCGLWISHSSCSFYKDDHSAIFLSLDLILAICTFDVSNAIFFFGPILLLQILGIPMGSPLSPQLAIILCAYAEHRWCMTHPTWASHVAAVRYFDDLGIIAVYDLRSQQSFLNTIACLRSIVSTCYPVELLLEYNLSSLSLTLMRCTFSVSTDRVLTFTYVNKNSDCIASGTQTFVRYRHFSSFFPRSKLITTCLSTVHTIRRFSSSSEAAYAPCLELIQELRNLDYPWIFLRGIFRRACRRDPASTLWPLLRDFCHR